MTQSDLHSKRALLFDLDGTLYDYGAAEKCARERLIEQVSRDTGVSTELLHASYNSANAHVKERIGGRGSAHSRLLYLHELVHARSRLDCLGKVRGWERLFWQELIAKAELRPGVRELLASWRNRGGKIGIVTDLTLEIQLWKLEAFDLLGAIDALAASEEVPFDKPAIGVFDLALERLRVSSFECVVIGDSESKDGDGARSLRIPFLKVDSDETFSRVARELLS